MCTGQDTTPWIIQTAQAATCPREAVEFHFNGFHWATPQLLWIHSHSGHCRQTLQASLIHSDSWHYHQPRASEALLTPYILQAQYTCPCHLRPGSVFALHFFRFLRKSLNMCLHFMLCYHPEGDGQTEHTNQTLKQYIQVHQVLWPEYHHSLLTKGTTLTSQFTLNVTSYQAGLMTMQLT